LRNETRNRRDSASGAVAQCISYLSVAAVTAGAFDINATHVLKFVKEADARTAAYKALFETDECWELDALSPTVIVDLVRVAVMDLMDADLWERAEKREQRNIRLIGETAANWTLVAKALRQSKDRK
jgi:hypothetical protein